MADANILQGAIFHEDAVEDNVVTTTESAQFDNQKINVENLPKSLEAKPRQENPTPKPAVHRVREQFGIFSYHISIILILC